LIQDGGKNLIYALRATDLFILFKIRRIATVVEGIYCYTCL